MRPFAMERWQSVYENRVEHNLSESGVHPLTLGELVELADEDPAAVLRTPLSYGQSNGTDELRAEIAALYPEATDSNVLVTNGGAEANFVALWELLEEGGEVVILVPNYMQTYGLAEALGAPVREVWLHQDAGWQPDPDEIATAVTDRTRVIVVTNPNNPTGAVLSAEARAALIRAADRAGAWILADEVYTGAELHGSETPSFLGEYPRVVATGSLSKAYALPGLRIGWAVAPAELTERLWARTDYTTIGVGELTDRLAVLALRPVVRARLLDRVRSYLRDGLDTLTDWFDAVGGFTVRPPDAGAICYARYALPIDSLDLVQRLRAEESVLLVPGAHFGMGRFLRFGYGLPTAELSTALECTGRTLARIRESAAQPG